jgi:hypothetical protein
MPEIKECVAVTRRPCGGKPRDKILKFFGVHVAVSIVM